jgi:hypothetical protein
MTKKTAYIGYSEEDVRKMENGFFVLQLGGDFVFEDGFYLFTKNEINKLYSKTLKDILGIIKNGSEKDRAYALNLIPGLLILPMRLH